MIFSKKIPPLMLFSALLILFFLLHVALLSPVIFRVSSDVVFEDSFIPLTLEIVLELVYLSIYVITFSFIALATLRGGSKNGGRFLLTFSLLTVLRYGSNIFFSYLYDGGIPSSQDVILSDLLDGLLASVLDVFQAAFCFAVVLYLTTKSKKRYDAALKWARKHGDEKKAEEYNSMKWESVFGLSNPVQLALFLSAALIAITKISGRMIYDISLSQMGIAPTASEIPLMIAYYASDLVFGLLIYLGSLTVVWFSLAKSK